MRRPLLVLLALLPAATTVAPAAAPARYPRGEAVFRPECFGSVEYESVRSVGVPTGGATRQSGPTLAAPPPPPAAVASAPDDSFAAPGKSSDKKPKAGRADARDASAPMAEEPPAIQFKREVESEFESAERDGERKSAEGEAGGEDLGRFSQDELLEAPRSQTTSLDWGATVYLSNDDSMSLASAQRALYAVMNGVALSVREIRPHELLNYFSFDTVTPDADQTFDVLASAEQHGDRLSVALAVRGATPPRQPLDLTVVLDRSCSMQAEGRMEYTKRGLTLMADSLADGDRLDVVLFDDAVCTPLENFVVGRDDPSMLQRTIAAMQPLGATDLDLGLREGYRVAKSHLDVHGRNRRMLVVTDALLNTGDVNPTTVSEVGKAYESDGIRMTGVGVGTEFNDEVLDLLTEKGKGAYVFLGSEAVVDRVFGASGFASLTQTIAHDVHFALKLPPSLAMERFYGEEASTDIDEVQPVHYYAGTSQVFLQDLVTKGGRVVASDPVELEITYRDALTGEPEKRVFRTTVGKMIEADPHNVRKAQALMAWTDLITADAMGADPCGKELSTYAGRAARLPQDAEIAFVNGLVRSRCGAFDLPAVVSDRGVPFKVRVDADIPISTVALDCAGRRSTEALSGSDVIATFTEAPGVCELTLSGTVDMTARVEIPTTGGDLRCVVRGGRLSCG